MPPAKKQKVADAAAGSRSLLSMFKAPSASSSSPVPAADPPKVDTTELAAAAQPSKENKTSSSVGSVTPSQSSKASPAPKKKVSSASLSKVVPEEDLIQKAHAAIDCAKAADWAGVYAAFDACKEIVDLRPEVREFGVLHQAAYHGDEGAVKTLIDKYGANAKVQTKFGETALEIAKKQGHEHVVESLAALCSSRMFTRLDGLTPEKESKKALLGPMPAPVLTEALVKEAHALIDLAKDGLWDKVYKQLEGKPELVNVRPEVREYGILHQAAYLGDEVAVDKLLKTYRADPDMLTRSGNTTALVANMQGHAKIALSLDNGGAELTDAGGDDDVEMKQMPDGSWKVVAIAK